MDLFYNQDDDQSMDSQESPNPRRRERPISVVDTPAPQQVQPRRKNDKGKRIATDEENNNRLNLRLKPPTLPVTEQATAHGVEGPATLNHLIMLMTEMLQTLRGAAAPAALAPPVGVPTHAQLSGHSELAHQVLS